ncbi:MAG TPA: uroporphyrinogen decarboxylase [Acetobacteraceae bacterium]
MKPVLRALRGEPVWPPPVWLMRQAGRYLPEYRALRAKAGDFITLCTTPALATEITLQPIRRFGFDAAILFSDILLLPYLLGQHVEYREGEGPVLTPLRDAAALHALDPARLANGIDPVLETIRRLGAALATEHPNVTLIGFAGAPFTVASYMVEGGGSKDFAATRLLARQDPPLFDRLLDLLTTTTIDYLRAQVEAGAEVLMLFDSWAGILPPSLFRQYVIAPGHRIVAGLKQHFPQLPIIAFPRLAGLMLGEYAANVVPDGIGIDTGTDPALAACMVPTQMAVQGNLDPVALLAGGDGMRRDTTSILEAMRGRPFIFNLGHGVMQHTPLEHVHGLLSQIRAA